MHLDEQVAHVIGVERREEVLDGADALAFARERGGVVGLRHGADVGRDLDPRGQGDEMDAAVLRQGLEDHAGALARVETEAVDHGRVADGPLPPAGVGEERQGGSGFEPALALPVIGALDAAGARRVGEPLGGSRLQGFRERVGGRLHRRVE